MMPKAAGHVRPQRTLRPGTSWTVGHADTMTTGSAFSVLGAWGGTGERMLTPRAADAPVEPGLLVLLQTMNLSFLTDLGKVISPLPLIRKGGSAVQLSLLIKC